jgi:hypothetical protein
MKLRGVLALALLVPGVVACAPVPRSEAVLREFQRQHPCPSTGKQTGPCPGYVKDHIDPLCHTGIAGDRVENLWWQTIQEAKEKDIWEKRLCRVHPRPCSPRY